MVHRRQMALTRVVGDQLQQGSRDWLCPPDSSTNYNIGLGPHQDRTTTPFGEEPAITEWNAKGSLLWVHGKRAFSTQDL